MGKILRGDVSSGRESGEKGRTVGLMPRRMLFLSPILRSPLYISWSRGSIVFPVRAPAALLGTVETPPAAPDATCADLAAESASETLMYSLSSDAPSSQVIKSSLSTKTRFCTLAFPASSSLSCCVAAM